MAAPTVQTNTELPWLDQKHPLYEEMLPTWQKNSRRAEGGDGILDELWQFDWETKYDLPRSREQVIIVPGGRVVGRDVIPTNTALRPGEHYARRQDTAIYVNFPEIYSSELVGALMKERPAPTSGLDFGRLGQVRRKKDIDTPTVAELVYYNVDGVGTDGSQWDAFWSAQTKAAMHTGYRWIFVESPRQAPRTQIRQLQGFRPYLVGFDSSDVINYHYVDGQLAFACVLIAMRNPRLGEDGRLTGNEYENGYYWMVRRGYTGFGPEFSRGGWWLYNPDKELLNRGTWDKMDGEIPLYPLFYDRHPRIFGRPGTSELGNAAVALMNVGSAADFDAWDSSGSIQAVRIGGTDPQPFNLFLEKVHGGNRYAPLLSSLDDMGKSVPSSIQDLSTGAVVADVFEKRIVAILRLVDRIKSQETFGTKTSGLSEQAGYVRGQASRLAILADNLETCQNSVISALERRSGFSNPSGSTSWTRDFKLIELTTAAQSLLQLERIAGINSETLDSAVILASATDQGFVPDNQMRETVLNELKASAALKKAAAQQSQAPQVPGERARDMPPEPAQTNQPVKDQLDGPEIP